MSIKWGYEDWKCDGEYCSGDCDNCYKAELTKDDIESDGFVTPKRYLKGVGNEVVSDT